MRGEALLQEMENSNQNFNINSEMSEFQANCENVQAFMLNFPQNCKNGINDTLYKISIEFENTIKDFSSLVENLWKSLKNACVELYKYIVDSYKATVKWFKGEYQKLCNVWKKFKNNRISWEELKEILKGYSDDILDAFGWYILVDIIETVWDIIKDVWGTSKNIGNNVLNYLKNLKKSFKDVKTESSAKLLKFLAVIIPLFAQLLATVLAILELAKKKKAQEISDNIFEDPTLDIHDKLKQNDSYYDNSLLLEYLQKYGNIPDNYKEIYKDKLSVCPVYEIDDEVFLQEKNGYIIEISKEISDYRFIKNVGENIIFNEIIGYIQDFPIYSIIQGKISDISDRRMIIFPEISNSSIELENAYQNILNKGTEDKEFDIIYNKYLDNLHIEDLIRDYLFDGIKSLYISNHSGVKKTSSYKEYLDLYNNVLNEHKLYTNTHDNNIKDLCSADNIQSKAEKEYSNIKDEIYEIKEKYIKNLLKTVNESDIKTKYQKKLEYNDLLLFDYYLNFYIEKKDYEYKNNNPFIVKFFNIIKDFMIKRYFLENDVTINSLILKFNIIAKYFNKNDYFKKIDNNIKNTKYDNVYNFIIKDNSDLIKDEEDEKIIKKLAIFFILIKDIQKVIKDGILDNKTNRKEKFTKHKGSETELKNQALNEREIIVEFLNEIKSKYSNFNSLENELLNYNKRVNWPPERFLFVNNIKYIHYLFENELMNNNINDVDILDIPFDTEGLEEYNHEIDTYKYWLRYCMIATLMNCVNPLYWATGLILPTGPLMLPIILIPIAFIKGKCSCLIGLGICGIAVYPFMLYINMSSDVMSYIIIINILIEMFYTLMDNIKTIEKDSIKNMIDPMIKTLDEKIKALDNDIKLLDDEILTLKSI